MKSQQNPSKKTTKFDVKFLSENFDILKAQADQITNLNQKELFYAEFGTQYKHSINKGNILQQISDETTLIQRTKQLSPPDYTDDRSLSLSKCETAPCLKIRAVLIMEMLKEIGISTANTDLTKIGKFISYVTGNSNKSIYAQLQKGINFTTYHAPHITQANKILLELNSTIAIDMQKQY
jgi:hypothetical protein